MTKMKLNSMKLSLAFMLLLAACSLGAQEFTGRVTDATGAVMPRVTVTAHNVDTGVDIKAVTNGSGVYAIPYLHHGNYTVSAEAKGFRTDLREGITLQVDETSVVNFTLQVGSETVTVTVNADTVLDVGQADVGEVVEESRVAELPLNGRDPTMLFTLAAGVTTNNPFGYTRPFDDNGKNISVNNGGVGNIEMLLDGTANNDAPINITGGSTEGIANTAYTTPVDSVQEFKMVTSPYDAKYGLMSGGVADIILKSGTNKIHGDAYEFARRTFMNANSWENDWKISQLPAGSNTSALRKPTYTQDQYGFELDGPIVVPKLYNGRNKSFFTLQWEHFHALSPLTDVASIPDGDWASGNFSNLDYWTGSGYAPKYIFDPTTSVQDTNSASPTYQDWIRTQFDGSTYANANTQYGNVIPSNRVDGYAATVLKLFPHCYKTGTSLLTGAKSDPGCLMVNGGRDHWNSNYALSTTGHDSYNNILLKWDENWSSRDRFTLRYGYWMRNTTYNGNGMPPPLSTGQVPIVARVHSFATEEVHTFNSNLLFEFKANVVVRADLNRGGSYYDPTALGWSASEIASMGPAANNEFPGTFFGGQNCQYWGCDYTSVGSSGNTYAIKNSMNLAPTVTWIKGVHTIHAGLDARFWQNGYSTLAGGSTTYTGGNWSQYTANHVLNIQNDGNDFASYLQGVPDVAGNQIWPQTYQAEHYWAPFIQDDWKVTKKLTLNLGLRWDWMPALWDRKNRGNYAFDTVSVNPYLSSVTIPTSGAYGSQYDAHGSLVGGVTFLGVNGNPKVDYKTINTNWQPRVGFAYAWNDKTVVRGGFGKSMQTAQNGPPVNGYSAYTAGVTSNPNYASGIFPNSQNKFESLFWGGPTGAVLEPSGSSLGLGTNMGQGPSYINPHLKNPSFWSYSLGIERQIGKNSSVDASYVGSRLYDGVSSGNINLQNNMLQASCSPLYGGNPNNCSSQSTGYVANPFKGIQQFAGSSYLTASLIDTLDLSRPMPQFGDVTENDQNDARTWFNSLQITALYRVSNSLTLHGTETWSRAMDAGSWTDQNYGIRARHIDSADMAQRVTLSAVYQLPIGRGRLLLPTANRIVDGAIGGWELTGLSALQSGQPETVPTYYLHNAKVKRHIQADHGYIRVFAPFAEHYVQQGSQWVVQQYEGHGVTYDYDGSNPGSANFMDVPSYSPKQDVDYSGIREAGVKNFDSSLAKNFSIWEDLKLQVRIDAFNVLNHPEWTGNASTSTTDPNLGVINKGPTGPSNGSRVTQLSAKITW